MFENGFEFDPKAAAFGLIGGIVSVFTMSKVDVGIIFKIGSFVLTTIVCYFMVQFIANKQ